MKQSKLKLHTNDLVKNKNVSPLPSNTEREMSTQENETTTNVIDFDSNDDETFEVKEAASSNEKEGSNEEENSSPKG